MSSDGADVRDSGIAIRVRDVSKHYVMFERPEDRFKQMVVPRLERMVGRPPRRYFRDFAALSSVSLEIGRGETVGIIGRNGSGKSTLLQIICGTLQPTSGSIEVNGRVAALLELGAGFNPEFTGRENAFLNAAILGVPRKEMEWRFDDIARFADIGPFIDQPVKTYSSGMYVRLAFATAINVDPDILVVDEALAVGDEAFQRKCFARIEQIKDKGGTILFVSHGAQTIVQLCSRAILMDGGEKIMEGRPKTVVGQYQRLVNASADSAAQIRAQIISLQNGARNEGVATSSTIDGQDELPASERPAQPNNIFPDDTPQNVRAEDDAADFYDSSLVSQSAVALEEQGGRIHDVRLTTLEGRPVNVLRMGKRYVVEYRVDFSRDVHNVGAGFKVRNVDGLGLAGGHTGAVGAFQVPVVKQGQVCRMRFEFSCLMLPGTYFLNCGVTGILGSNFVVLHRVVDILAFRVASERDLLATGRFDIGVSQSISIC